MDRQVFNTEIHPKKNALQRLQKDTSKLRGDDREILLSFVTDPYQPIETELEVTRQAIRILVDNGLRFTILTKGGVGHQETLTCWKDTPRPALEVP